jgi:hypothetical protein
MRRRACLLAIGIPLLALALLARALPTRAAGVVGDGTAASCTYAAFLTALGGGGLVTFDCGPQPHTITLASPALGIVAAPNTTIDGGTPGRIALSGDGDRRLFFLQAGNALTLTRLTLADGFANAPGGAIANQGGRLVLDEVVLRHNMVTATWGGGAIYNYLTATLTIRNSTLSDNVSHGGGAIFNDGSSQVGIEDSQFLSNTVDGLYGGAILNYGMMTATNTLFSGNVIQWPAVPTGTVGGGGLANMPGARVQLDFVTFAGNHVPLTITAFSGGGALNLGEMTVQIGDFWGNSAALGGGLAHWGGDFFLLSNGNLMGNTARTGGGLYFHPSNPSASNASVYFVSIADNVADYGGGLGVGSGRLLLSQSLIEGNTALSGGGAYVSASGTVLEITDTTLRINEADYGGAVFSLEGTVLLNRAALYGNQAGTSGGGMLNHGQTRLTNVTVSANHARMTGGGIYNELGPVHLLNVTLAGNSAPFGGGALYTAAGQTTVMTNTIVAGSTSGGNCDGPIAAANYSLSSDLTCGLPAGNNLNGVDPLLSGLGDYGGPTLVHMPAAGSPAVDGVVGNDAPATDQRNLPRPALAGFDIGAVERQAEDVSLILRALLPLVGR